MWPWRACVERAPEGDQDEETDTRPTYTRTRLHNAFCTSLPTGIGLCFESEGGFETEAVGEAEIPFDPDMNLEPW